MEQKEKNNNSGGLQDELIRTGVLVGGNVLGQVLVNNMPIILDGISKVI